MPPAASQKVLTYEVQERVLCFHGPMLYEAKVLEVKKSEDKKELPEYKVHYKGWKNTFVIPLPAFDGFGVLSLFLSVHILGFAQWFVQ